MGLYSEEFLMYFTFQFPITALREIRILKLLKHDNVVNLQEICRTKGKVTLVLTVNPCQGYDFLTIVRTFDINKDRILKLV